MCQDLVVSRGFGCSLQAGSALQGVAIALLGSSLFVLVVSLRTCFIFWYVKAIRRIVIWVVVSFTFYFLSPLGEPFKLKDLKAPTSDC